MLFCELCFALLLFLSFDDHFWQRPVGQLPILCLGLQGAPHDLRSGSHQRLLQLLSNDLLWDILDVDPVAVDHAFHLPVHFNQKLLALFIDHLARHLQFVFFGAHDRTEVAVIQLLHPPVAVVLLRNIIWTDRRFRLLPGHWYHLRLHWPSLRAVWVIL